MSEEAFRDDPELTRSLDAADPLRASRDQFHIPKRPDGGDEIYLCGHSLGLQPKRARAYVEEELEKWQRLAVRGHFEGPRPWLPYHTILAEPMARLIGARTSEVVTMNSLTTNLHLMMVSFYRPTPSRHKILIETHAFPSDRFAVESQIRFHGHDPRASLLVARPRDREEVVRQSDLLDFIDRQGDSIALILLPGVQYYTGQRLNLEAVTSAGHARGCLVGFDLAHAAGNIPLRLHEWDVDFACWCTYKYMNSGPGSVGGAFVHDRHARSFEFPRFAGWWGHDQDTRFRMEGEFKPMAGAEGWQLSNPPILSLAAIRASLEVFQEAGGVERLHEKSIRLTGFLEFLLRTRLGEAIEIITPADPAERGCQLSLKIVSGQVGGSQVLRQLEQAGIMADWREPNVVRVAPVPLYNTFEDVDRFARALSEVVASS